ncbi:MAG: GNAT family N-acetyltransferase [Methanobacteriaceae archaeon]|nr:GNAT family N-acetyltransferase [Methanobacteriaceae archaeon]
MDYFRINELQKADDLQINVKNFLFNMIRDEFGYGFIPEYHQDIKKMGRYYLDPERNTFFLAIHQDTGRIIGTIGVRAYDKDFPLFRDIYNSETTASLWRVFVDKKWRRNGVASSLVRRAEDFCRVKGYDKIYLHTQKTVKGSLDFWISNGYQIVDDTGNQLQTVHMEKKLYHFTPVCDEDEVLIFQG